MNETPLANRLHIAFFGRRNAGKSSLVNAVTGQNLSIVSPVKGTTTDPVYKAMELLPLGPVVIIDTPGLDDEGELGALRVQKALQVLRKTDIAVLVLDAEENTLQGCKDAEEELIKAFEDRKLPYILVLNKSDKLEKELPFKSPLLPVSAKTGFNINKLKEKIALIINTKENLKPLVEDIVKPGDFVVLVIPIDKAAPKGRLILPQQQVIRGILEAGGTAISVRDTELKDTLAKLGKPSLVITDSQVFAKVSKDVPQEIPLTSFSILFARYKGFLKTAVEGAAALDTLRAGDKILICEGCTHHRQCDDIGTVKLPKWIREHFGTPPAEEGEDVLTFQFCSGGDFPKTLSPFKLVIHCGACMLNEREMHYRRRTAEEQNVPFTNYGTAIAHIQGILKRSIEMFSLY